MTTSGRRSLLLVIVTGSLGMVVLGTVELWSGRIRSSVDADSSAVTLLLALAPLGVMVVACRLVHRRLVTRGTPALAAGGRTRRTASAGAALLTVAAVLLVQASLFGASSALVGQIGCGRGDDDWCGFGSGIIGLMTLVAGSTVGVVGAVLLLAARRTAARR